MDLYTSMLYLSIFVTVRISALERMSTTPGNQSDRSNRLRHSRDDGLLGSNTVRRDKRIIPMLKVYVNDETLSPKPDIEKRRNPEFKNLWKQQSLFIARNKGRRNRMATKRYGTVWIPFGWKVYQSAESRGLKAHKIDSGDNEGKSTTQNHFDSLRGINNFREQRGKSSSQAKNKGINISTINRDSVIERGNRNRKEKLEVKEFRASSAFKTETLNTDHTSTPRYDHALQNGQRFYPEEHFQGKGVASSPDSNDGANLSDNNQNFAKVYTRKYTDPLHQESQQSPLNNRVSLTSNGLDQTIVEDPDSFPKMENKSLARLMNERRQYVMQKNQRRRILFKKLEQRRKMMMARRRQEDLERSLSVSNKVVRNGSGKVVTHTRMNGTEPKYSRANNYGNKIKNRFFRTEFADNGIGNLLDSARIYDEDSLKPEDSGGRRIKYSEKDGNTHTIRPIHSDKDDVVTGRMNKKKLRLQKIKENVLDRIYMRERDFRGHQATRLLGNGRKNRRRRQERDNIAPSSRLARNSFGRSDLTIIPRKSKHEQLFRGDNYRRGRASGEVSVNGVSMIKERVLAEVVFGGRTQSQKSKKTHEDPIIIRVIGDQDGRRTVQITVTSPNF